jgi:hypothetical protein
MRKFHVLMMVGTMAVLIDIAVRPRERQTGPSAPLGGVEPSAPATTPAAIATQPSGQSAESIPVPGERFTALIAELRPKVDAALRASDFQAADGHVDEALTMPDLEPLETQRLMAMKMTSRGMRGDHAAMLALMDEITAIAPDSPLSAQLGKERPQIEKIQRLGPNHPELCETCGQMHAPGAHPAAKGAGEPQNSSAPITRTPDFQAPVYQQK